MVQDTGCPRCLGYLRQVEGLDTHRRVGSVRVIEGRFGHFRGWLGSIRHKPTLCDPVPVLTDPERDTATLLPDKERRGRPRAIGDRWSHGSHGYLLSLLHTFF